MLDAIDAGGSTQPAPPPPKPEQKPQQDGGWFADLVGDAAHGLAGAWHATTGAVTKGAEQTAGFVKGVGEGAGGAVVGMAKGVYDLGKDGVKFATNAAFRGQVVRGAENLASNVAHHPVGTAEALGKAALHAGESFLRGVGTAAQEGELGAYLGEALGSAAVNLGSAFIPGVDAAEGLSLASRLGEGGELLGDAAKGLEAGSALARGSSAAAEDTLATGRLASRGALSASPDNKAVELNARDDYRAASREPKPNTTYRYAGHEFTTDELGRGVKSSGKLTIGNGGNRFHDDRLIGYPHNPDAMPGDIGFHAGADQFGFPGGKLNVFPGNNQLNSAGGAYGRFENTVLRPLASDPSKTVQAEFSRIFYDGNLTSRPDEMQIVYRVNDEPPVTVTFLNQEGK